MYMKLESLEVSRCECDEQGNETIISHRGYAIEGNKIPKELVQSFVVEKEVTTERVFGKLTTILKYRLQNGFTGVESVSCVDEVNYSKEIGEKILLERLEDKIWFGLGFALGMANN